MSFQGQISKFKIKVIGFIIIQIFSRFRNNLQEVLTITREQKYLVDYNLWVVYYSKDESIESLVFIYLPFFFCFVFVLQVLFSWLCRETSPKS